MERPVWLWFNKSKSHDRRDRHKRWRHIYRHRKRQWLRLFRSSDNKCCSTNNRNNRLERWSCMHRRDNKPDICSFRECNTRQLQLEWTIRLYRPDSKSNFNGHHNCNGRNICSNGYCARFRLLGHYYSKCRSQQLRYCSCQQQPGLRRRHGQSYSHADGRYPYRI